MAHGLASIEDHTRAKHYSDMNFSFCVSGVWDQGNILGSPKSLAMSEQNEGVQNNHESSETQQDELKATQNSGEVPVDENGVPQIILQPPSSPGTEEEDNCETTETELENNRDDEDDHHEQTKLRRYSKEKRSSKEEKSYSAVEDKMDSRSQKNDNKKEETLVDIETDDEKNGSSFTPQPPIALFFKEQEDFPAPPDNTDGGSITLNKGSASHDLMFFSESNGHPKKDQECTRTSYEDDLWIPMEKPRTSSMGSTGSADFPPPPSPPTIRAMECTCEITPEENRELDQTTPKNGLFSDVEGSKAIGRPSPIVLTMAKNGPVTNAVSVKQPATGDARSNPPSSPRSVSESTGTQSTMFPDHSRSGIQKSYSTDIRYLSSDKSEPIGTRPVSTSDMNNQHIRSVPTLKQRAGSEGWVSPKSRSPPEQHRNVQNSKNNSSNSDINEFPPPPPPLSNDSGRHQADSPWVPLLQRFQVEQDSAMYMDSEENHRRPRPKPGSTTQDQRSQKFRSYAPNSKPSIVEVKNSEGKKDKQNETCV